jgi:hypothetical protein
MKRVKRTPVIVIPKQPFTNWANSVDDGRVKFGDNLSPEHTIYLVKDITDFVVDSVDIIKPHFEFIFKEELNSWHRLESNWPPNRDLETFLEWFEIQIHSMVLDLPRGRLKTERYAP